MHTDRGTYVIAEAGVNHNGDVGLARRLIDVAADSGADAVKFQTFRPDLVATKNAPKAEYQARTTDSAESMLDMAVKLQLSEEDHEVLIGHAKARGIEFLSTPFDLPSLVLLTDRFGLEAIKIASGEITNAPLILAVARSARRVFLSTGMSTLGEVEMALQLLAFGFSAPMDATPAGTQFMRGDERASAWRLLEDRVTVLHCTTEYPAPFSEVNLRAMDTIAAAFGLPVGYSDHTPGIHVALAAVARGASVIEKHFTLDRNLPGPDHLASIEPPELDTLVRQIRQIDQALGDGIKRPTASEWKNRGVARKSVVAAKAIRLGETFTVQNLACKRPGTGISAERFYEVLGRAATREYAPDDLINE